MTKFAVGFASICLLIVDIHVAFATDFECFHQHAIGTFGWGCQFKDPTIFCTMKTANQHAAFQVLTRTNPEIYPPETKLIFYADSLNLTKDNKPKVRFQFGHETAVTQTARAITSNSVVADMNLADLAFWVTSGMDPDVMKFSVDGEQHTLVFPHADFRDSLNNMLACLERKD